MMFGQYIFPGLLFVLAGALEALMDTIAFHNDSNSRFWGNQSWLNKYRNRDPKQGQTFKGKYFTFMCDGWHLTKFGTHLFVFTSLSLLLMNNYIGYHWWQYGLVASGAWGCRGIGFNIGWYLISKKMKLLHKN